MLAHVDRLLERFGSWLVNGIGLAMLVVGIGAALLAPVEIYVYYFFTEGGRFHYPGFGFGSFMFAFISVQIAGYYVLALLLIPLGYGHLTRKRWAQSLTLTAVWVWLVAGLPLTLLAYSILFLAKDLDPAMIVLSLTAGPLLYPLAPLGLLWFYRRADIRDRFSAGAVDWLDTTPLPVRGLCGLLLLTMICLHGLFLVRGVFPWFGWLLHDLTGFVAIDGLLAVLAVVTWGLARQWRWAWWGALGVFGALAVSTVMTFAQVSVRSLMTAMQFPAYEVELFANVPFLDTYWGVTAAAPAVVLLVLLIGLRRYFSHSAAAGNPWA